MVEYLHWGLYTYVPEKNMKEFKTYSDQETKKLAARLAGKMKSGVIALSGQLGAGKTTFVQGFAKSLGIKEKVISPTFIIVRQHKIPGTKKMLYHIDLYRMEDQKQIQDLGLKDLFNNSNNLVLVEWAERAKELIPSDATWISFENLGGESRSITLA